MGASRLGAAIFHLDSDERRLMFGLTSGKAAATIAATMIGYQHHLLSEDMMNGAVMMILICCIVASVFTEAAAKKIRIARSAAELESDGPRKAGFARQIVAVSNPLTAEGIMRMAAYMRSPLNEESITALYIRSDDDPRTVSTGHRALEEARGVADAMEIPFEEVERFDLNIMSGMVNVLRERRATEIILGLHRRSRIVDSFFGAMTEQLLASTSKMIVLSRCFLPVDTLGRFYVYVPRNAEYETGFPQWIARVSNMASQLSRRVFFISYPSTSEQIEAHIEMGGYSFGRVHYAMESWDDFLILSSQVTEEDLLIVVGARKGSVSYNADYENMPSYLSRHFSGHNLAMIIPGQFGA